jgi:hypothetical protein
LASSRWRPDRPIGRPQQQRSGIRRDRPTIERRRRPGGHIAETVYYIVEGRASRPETIGTATSSGCIRLTNDDVIDLYNRVHIGTTVVVLR